MMSKIDLSKIITIYGRKPVLEALEDHSIEVLKLHLSESNAPSKILDSIVALAQQRAVPIETHSKRKLSFISKNAKQDQGVALDIAFENSLDPYAFFDKRDTFRILALDRIHNPQNLGMILRSAAAGNIDAVMLGKKGTAALSPLVIKASAGTFFRIPILRCEDLPQTLHYAKQKGATLYALSSHADSDFRTISYAKKTIFVLGNESEGISEAVAKLCDKSVSIPMRRGVESLNVAVTAALLSFLD